MYHDRVIFQLFLKTRVWMHNIPFGFGKLIGLKVLLVVVSDQVGNHNRGSPGNARNAVHEHIFVPVLMLQDEFVSHIEKRRNIFRRVVVNGKHWLIKTWFPAQNYLHK